MVDRRREDVGHDGAVPFTLGERVRVTLINDTMMAHPIHLHGHFFELVTGHGDDDQPGSRGKVLVLMVFRERNSGLIRRIHAGFMIPTS